MKLFFPLRLHAVAAFLIFLLAGGMPGIVHSQVFNDEYGYDPSYNPTFDPYYDSYYDPYYDPYFGAYDYDYVLTDQELRANIIRDLAMSPFVDRNGIHVSVNDGIATLSGRVEDRSAMVDAVETAYDAGAWRVRNKLRKIDTGLRPWAEMEDNELREEIADELAFSPFVNADRVTVTVEDGVATLYGGVENKGEIAEAVEYAYEAGAERVKSRLWVDPDLS